MVSTRRKRINGEEEAAKAITIEKKVSSAAENYEDFREQRIKENKERMQKLGIVDLALSLNSKPLKTKKSNQTIKKVSKQVLPFSADARRSSRLKTMTPVDYTEINIKTTDKASKDLEIRIKEGSEPEIYTAEHEKLLGDYKMGWNLQVDGYGKDGKRIYDSERGETCHQCSCLGYGKDGKRIYDSERGETCHQCRQKTLGRHTHCIQCQIVQGQFCGDCLFTRYGENVMEVNKNPNWICPVCRGICNCSLCRKAKGWEPTGQIYKKVKRLGFKSVAHYLIQTRGRQLPSEDMKKLATEEKESQPAGHEETINANEHEHTSPDLQSADDEFVTEEEDQEVKCSDITDGDEGESGDNTVDDGR